MSKRDRTGHSWQVKLLSLFLTASLVFSLMPNTFAFAADSEAEGNDVSQEVLSDQGANKKEETPATDVGAPDEEEAKAAQEEAMNLSQNTAVQVPETRALSDAVDVVDKGFVKMNDAGDTIVSFSYWTGVSPSKIFIPKTYKGTTITTIAANAFAGCALTEVYFAGDSALTSLGEGAFKGNPITSITLPSGITDIKNSTFEACPVLSSVSFLGAVTALGSKTFFGCTSLTSFSFPETLKSLGDSCFYNAKLTSADLSRTQVTAIPGSAFYGNKLTGFLFPSKLVSIGDNAFCTGTAQAFTFSLPSTVTTIGTVAFNGIAAKCTIDLSLFKVGSIANAPWRAFNATVKWGYDDSADSSPFLFNTDTRAICGLKSSASLAGNVEIPASIDLKAGGSAPVTAIADGAFATGVANGVKSLTFSADSKVTSVGFYAFATCAATSIVLPSTLTTIGNRAFFSMKSLTALTIPKAVTSIGTDATFSDCSNLERVTIGDESGSGLQSMDQSVFATTPKLTSISIPGKNKGTISNAPWKATYATITWKDGTVAAQSATSDDGLWQINTTNNQLEAYKGSMGSDKEIILPSSVKIGGVDFPLVSMAATFLPAETQCKKVTIPGNYAAVSNNFALNVKIDEVVIGEGVKTIGDNAFRNNNASRITLTTLTLPSSLRNIAQYAFYGSSLKVLNLPEGLQTMGAYAFAKSSQLAASSSMPGFLVLPSTLTSCSGDVFSECPSITNIFIKQNRNGGSSNGYPDSPDAVKNVAPWGAGIGGKAVFYFMDDPKPAVSFSSQNNSATNTVTITLTTRMDPAIILIDSIAVSGGYEITQKGQDGKVENYYTASIVVDKNATYQFSIKFTVDGVQKSYPCETTINSFYGVSYNANGADSGEVPATKGYLSGASVTAAASSLTKSGFTFSGWSTSATAGAQGAKIYAPGDTFSMGGSGVTLYALWLKSAALSLSANPVETYYGQNITLKAVLSGADNPTGTITFYDKGGVVGTQSVGADASTSFLLTGASAGTHQFSASYSGDAKNVSSKTSELSYTVKKASQAAPAAVAVTGKSYNSLTVSTDSHCKYIVVPAGQSAPAINASGWVEGEGNAYTFDELNRDSSYDLYAYVPGSDNYLDSSLSVVTTAQTNKENITSVSAPSYGDSFPNWCKDAAAAIAYFPVDATVITEGISLDSLPFAWTCDSYDPTPGVSNTFSWQVSAPSGYSFMAGVVTSGTVSVKNAAALPVDITPHPQTASYAPNLSFAVADLFTIDVNAGAPSYSVVSGPGELSADKTTVAITGVGTVLVHIDTLAQGSYAAGSADASIIVRKAIQAAPAAVAVIGKTYNSLTVSTDSRLKYIVVPTGQSAPTINASGWVNGTGSAYTFDELERDSAYDLYAYAPETDNYHDSPLSAVTTAQTNKENITSVSAPSYSTSFPDWCKDAAAAIAHLPVETMVTTEGTSLDSLPLTWTCDSYDTALGASNTFSWQVSAPSGYSFTGGVAFSGTLSIKNISAFPVGITPHPQTASYAPDLSFAVADLFTIDANAGAPSYSVVSGSGELSADKTTVAVTGVGTVIVRVETLAQGSYAAGSADVSIIVSKATQAAPAAVAVTGKTYNSLTVSTDSHCKYIVVPAGQSAPAINASGWVEGEGSDYTFAGLNRDSSYDLYAYTPETDNYLDSPLSAVTTAQTNKENITSVSAPSYGDSFPNWCKDVATAIAYLPVESTITTEGISLDSLPFAWMCDSYDPTPGVSNTFSWQVSAPLGYSFVAGVVTSGTVSVKNAAATSYGIEFLSGTTWTQGSSEGFTVSSSADLARFVAVKVDGATADPSNYAATSGSTHITFAPDYLSTLGIGVHSIRIVSADGEAVGTFEILAANEKEPTGEVHPLDQPPVASLSQAGDREGLLGGSVVVVLMLLSVGVGVRARYRKKEH